ncbi:MAG: hypothetical protein LM598_05265 [Candidatus Verstraetearchaeota archaeon]|nr:hypothetical protein [Candidatus Verstraetearchaeota archaeon]
MGNITCQHFNVFKQLKFVDYRTVELGGVVTQRNVVASWNIALRAQEKLR